MRWLHQSWAGPAAPADTFGGCSPEQSMRDRAPKHPQMWLRNTSRKSDVQIHLPSMTRPVNPHLGQTSSQLYLWFWGSGLLQPSSINHWGKKGLYRGQIEF